MQLAVKHLTTLAVLWMGGLISAQNSVQPSLSNQSVYTHINNQATLSRAGNSAAAKELSRQLFRNIAVSPDLADTFGFTDRIAHAEISYRSNNHRPVRETDIVRAVNNLANTIGAPQWARTNTAEVRKLRMHLVVIYPQLIASQKQPSARGNFEAVSEKMSPMEASYVAATMVYQKIYNVEYQFTEKEKQQNSGLAEAAIQSEHEKRVQALTDIVQGRSQTTSIRDLLPAADSFFSDLGIDPLPTPETKGVPVDSDAQGGR